MIIILILFLIMAVPARAAYTPTTAPVTATWLDPDFSFPTPEGWDAYFTDLREVGMDTIVLPSVGAVNRSGARCNGEFIDEPLDILLRTPNWLENVLIAAHKNNFGVYLGSS
jgi:hypothetical protein